MTSNLRGEHEERKGVVMKSSNLAWRIEPLEAPSATELLRSEMLEPNGSPQARRRPRPRFERRTIELRDQGFAPFRVR
jgi:hypothetical protein